MAGPGAKSDYIGSVVREPILAGEPIVARKIVLAGDSTCHGDVVPQPGYRNLRRIHAVDIDVVGNVATLDGDRIDGRGCCFGQHQIDGFYLSRIQVVDDERIRAPLAIDDHVFPPPPLDALEAAWASQPCQPI